MARATRTCPECGARVSARAAGCPRCGRILDAGPPGPVGAAEGDRPATAARPLEDLGPSPGGAGGLPLPAVACGGCLVLVLVAGAALWWIARSTLGDIADVMTRVTVEGDLVALRGALERYADDHQDRYPERLEVLLEEDGGRGPWLPEARLDPWVRPYRFDAPPDGTRASGRGRVYTLGRDGAAGGRGEDADLGEEDLTGLVTRER